MEVKVERLRTDISVAQNKADRYRTQIRDFQRRIDEETKKTSTDDLDDLNDMIETLKRFIPTVQ